MCQYHCHTTTSECVGWQYLDQLFTSQRILIFKYELEVMFKNAVKCFARDNNTSFNNAGLDHLTHHHQTIRETDTGIADVHRHHCFR